MQFADHIKSLLASFDKDSVIEDIDMVSEELKSNVLPIYKTAKDKFKTHAFQAISVKTFETKLTKFMKFKYKDNFINAIYESLLGCESVLGVLRNYAVTGFNDNITTQALNLRNLNVLQFVEIIGFIVRYARRFLNNVLIMETNALRKQDEFKDISKAELNYLQQGIEPFAKSLNLVHRKPTEYSRLFDEIPEVLVTSDTTDATVAMVGAHVADPLEMRFIPPVFNPIYHVRMAIADWQASRYKEAEEEMRVVQLRIYQLEKLKNGEEDPKLEQQIEYNHDRLRKLTMKVEKLREDYAV